jgi:hypothetical protein
MKIRGGIYWWVGKYLGSKGSTIHSRKEEASHMREDFSVDVWQDLMIRCKNYAYPLNETRDDRYPMVVVSAFEK